MSGGAYMSGGVIVGGLWHIGGGTLLSDKLA